MTKKATTKKAAEKRKRKNSFAQHIYGHLDCSLCGSKGNIADFFGKRVRDLRIAQKLTDKAVAGHIGVSLRRYHMLENGTSIPNIINVAFLAAEFDCSADYLLGRTNKYKG